jgi:hypothetical protein
MKESFDRGSLTSGLVNTLSFRAHGMPSNAEINAIVNEVIARDPEGVA